MAILAGFVSVVSPCVLPLIPTYLTYLAGANTGAAMSAAEERRHIMFQALLFIAGFSLIFIILGLSASAAGQALRLNLPLLRRLSGIIAIIFGLHLLGMFRIVMLDRVSEGGISPSSLKGKPGASLLLGVSFALGWTPCIGPVLASILLLAGQSGSVWAGGLLLAAYALGLGAPFLFMAYYTDRFRLLLRRHGHALNYMEKAAGLLIIVVGVLIFTNAFANMSAWFGWAF